MHMGQPQGEGINSSNLLEFKNISKEILQWLEQLTIENNCRIEKKEWRSKYNSYVVYDYEPFCSDGFEVNMTIVSSNKNNLKFIKYLYDNKINMLEYLKNCLAS